MQLKKRGKDRLVMMRNGKDTSLPNKISEIIVSYQQEGRCQSHVTPIFKPGVLILKGVLIVSTIVGYCIEYKT